MFHEHMCTCLLGVLWERSEHFLQSLCHVDFLLYPGRAHSVLLGPAQQCACNAFAYDTFEDHLQTCQTKSTASQVHDLVVYKLGTLLGSVGHRVKIHNITPTTGKERGDLEIKDYVVLQKPQTQTNRLPPPHTPRWGYKGSGQTQN